MTERNIGKKIRQLRKDWGLSQLELAERVGVSFQQIQKYEKGATRISVMRLKQVSKALGVNINHFFDDEEKLLQVSDESVKYSPAGEINTGLTPLNKEEIVLLKQFRKIKNKKLRESILKQIQGIIELEVQEP